MHQDIPTTTLIPSRLADQMCPIELIVDGFELLHSTPIELHVHLTRPPPSTGFDIQLVPDDLCGEVP